MAKHVLLNNVEHADLRIVTTRSAACGDDVMYAITFPWEFRSLQAHYPIVFRKRPDTGEFQPIVLFGFEPRENLFLTPDGWDAAYVPLTIERQPFLIGMQAAQDGPEPVVHIDMDSPRISQTEGEAVFLAHGGISKFLDRINSVLNTIHQGMENTPSFVTALLEFDLIESFVLDVGLKDGSQNRLAGFYTINEERLNDLAGPALEKLNTGGHLLPTYMAIASLSNIRDLIDRRNRRIGQ